MKVKFMGSDLPLWAMEIDPEAARAEMAQVMQVGGGALYVRVPATHDTAARHVIAGVGGHATDSICRLLLGNVRGMVLHSACVTSVPTEY